jgi:predicted NBD/HSP70 family sugar kinase
MVVSPAARPDDIRRRNLGLLLDHVHRDGALSRAELTQRLGLNRSTIGALVADLAALGLVTEHVPSGNERAGRPSHVVGPRSCGPYAIAVDVDADRVLSAAVALGGAVLARGEYRLDGHTKPREIIFAIVESISALRADVPDGWPIGVGVSIPGTIRRRDHHVDLAPNLHWADVEFGTELATQFTEPLSVKIANDADLGALAEHRRGAGRGYADLVYINGKIGVGGGLISGGNPVTGHDGLAGEVGHMMLAADGPLCRCGSRGCVETFIGEAALLKEAGRRTPPTRAAVDTVIEAARAGDPRACAAVRHVATHLGQAVGSLINLLNPELVILGGSLSDVLTIDRAAVEIEVERRAMSAPRGGVRLVPAGLGEDSSLMGAAELAFRALLEDPLIAAER